MFIHHCGTQVPRNLEDVYPLSAIPWVLFALSQGWETKTLIHVKGVETGRTLPRGS